MNRGLLWKALLAVSLGANVALIVAFAWPEGTAPAAPAAGDPDEERVLGALGLDAGQRATIERLEREFDGFRDRQHGHLREIRERLFEAVSQPDADRARIETLLAEFGAAQVEMRRRLVEHILGIAQVLRAEQRARFLDGIRDRFVLGRRPTSRGGEPACPPAGNHAGEPEVRP